jgi:hypothetical protein
MCNIRNQALGDIENSLKSEYETLVNAFELLDICIEYFCNTAEKNENKEQCILAIACCQTLIKARAYALGCYSVCLDGFHQQVKALLRPLTQALELMIYFRQDPTRAHFVYPKCQEDKLAAGYVAETIGETLKSLRDYLRSFVSPASPQPEYWIGIERSYSQEILKADMRALFSTMWMITRLAAECFFEIGLQDDHLSDILNYVQQRGLAVFQLAEYL